LAAAKSELLKTLVGEVVATREIQMAKLLREVGVWGGGAGQKMSGTGNVNVGKKECARCTGQAVPRASMPRSVTDLQPLMSSQVRFIDCVA
jgi:hypothetical protein